MKACFQIAECSFSSAKIRNISLSRKFLGDLLSILRKIAENAPDNLRKTDGGGGWRRVGDFFTKDGWSERGVEGLRERYSVTVVTVVTVFSGGGIWTRTDLNLLLIYLTYYIYIYSYIYI